MAITTQPEVLQVWPGAAPGSEGWTHQEQETVSPSSDQVPIVRNVVRPTLTAFLPEPAVASGTAAIVCPGGAFHYLAIAHEGTEVAHWLAARGTAAFVLRYRVVPTPADDEDFRREWQAAAGDRQGRREAMARVTPLAVADGRQAVKLVRKRAADWGIAPERVGMLGFSAGGMLTCGVALDREADARPAFAAPIYGAPFEAVEVPADAPPLFMALATDDALMAAACTRLYAAWREAGRSAELHAYAQGGHGFGMRRRGLPADGWIDRFQEWLQAMGLGAS